MAAQTPKPLYLITDGGKLRREGTLVSVVERALEGADGAVGYVQLREQASESGGATDREALKLAGELRKMCEQYGAKLVVSRRPDLAVLAEVDGVHLGSRSMPIEEVRGFLGPNKTIGYSAHREEEALAAFQAGANYVFISPIFPRMCVCG